MSPSATLVLRGSKFVALGALTGALLAVVTFLPGELMATADQPGGATISLPLVWGVCWACGRVGAVVGLIFFLIRRTLMGEVTDPRLVTASSTALAQESAESRGAPPPIGAPGQGGLHPGTGTR